MGFRPLSVPVNFILYDFLGARGASCLAGAKEVEKNEVNRHA